MFDKPLAKLIAEFEDELSSEDAEAIRAIVKKNLKPVPPEVSFTYYLHDDSTGGEMQEFIEEQTGIKISDELLEKMGKPFYEVGLDCLLDTATGEVRILGVLSS